MSYFIDARWLHLIAQSSRAQLSTGALFNITNFIMLAPIAFVAAFGFNRFGFCDSSYVILAKF